MKMQLLLLTCLAAVAVSSPTFYSDGQSGVRFHGALQKSGRINEDLLQDFNGLEMMDGKNMARKSSEESDESSSKESDESDSKESNESFSKESCETDSIESYESDSNESDVQDSFGNESSGDTTADIYVETAESTIGGEDILDGEDETIGIGIETELIGSGDGAEATENGGEIITIETAGEEATVSVGEGETTDVEITNPIINATVQNPELTGGDIDVNDTLANITVGVGGTDETGDIDAQVIV